MDVFSANEMRPYAACGEYFVYLLFESMRMAYLHEDRKPAQQWWDQLQKLSVPGLEGNWQRQQWDAFRAWLGVK